MTNRVPTETRAEIIDRYKTGQSFRALARRFDLNHKTIRKIVLDGHAEIRPVGRQIKPFPVPIKTLIEWHEAGESCNQIGMRLDVYGQTIRQVLRRSGYEPRNDQKHNETHRRPVVAGRARTAPPAPIEKLWAWHQAGESTSKIALRLGTYPNKVLFALRKAGYEVCDARNRRGRNSPIFAGGRSKNQHGYITVLLEPEDQRFKSGRCGRTMLEHRLVMARHLGRELFAHENVHHRNGVRDDNRLENLELWEKGQPCGQRSGEFVKAHCPTCTCSA